MRRQDAIVHRRQLLALGFSDDAIAWLVRGSVLRREHRGVYADARAPLTHRGRLLAAQLALGDTAFFSHRSAAALLGLRAVNVGALELTVVAPHTPRRARLTVRRTERGPHADELRTRDGLRHSSFARALIELAPREPRAELDRLIAAGARRRLLDLRRIDEALARRGRTPGIARLRAALAAHRPPAEDISTLERDFAAWLGEHPDLPEPRRNVHIGPWEVDFHWPEHGLAVETDGSPYHLTPAELERDRLKDTWLQRRGVHVMRVTDHRFTHDGTGILSDLRAFVRSADAA